MKSLPFKYGPKSLHPKTTFAWNLNRSTESPFIGSGASVVFSSHGDLLAATDTLGKVNVWRLTDFDRLADFDLGEFMLFDTLEFSPNGESLVVCTSEMLYCWDRATKRRRSLAPISDPCSHMMISPDGHTVVTTHFDRLTRFWDFQTGEKKGAVVSPSGRHTSAAMSPREPLLLLGTSTGHILRLNPTTHETLGEPLRHGDGLVETIVFFADGSRFATSSLLGGTVKIWDSMTFEEITTLTGHNGVIQRIVLSPDETKLVASGGAGSNKPSPSKRSCSF